MDNLRIVVTGLIGSIPLAGLALQYLQYVLGLRALGHDVLYLEDTGVWCDGRYAQERVEYPCRVADGLGKMMQAHGLADAWAFVDGWGQSHGLSRPKLAGFLKTADLLINVAGAGLMRDEYLQVPRRVYVDTDPGCVQFRIAQGSEKDLEHLKQYNAHLSFGCNIGMPGCLIPTLGFDWRPTVQPICLGLWPVALVPASGAPCTTVLKWNTYDPIEVKGELHGFKDLEFVKFQQLPQRTNQPFELAMVGNPPVESLETQGWRCRCGTEISSSIDAYRRYIHGSRAEWSVAKHGYVEMRSGWFGGRSAAYLASGRPVVTQDTGFSDWLDVGAGVVAFTTLQEAVAGIESINSNYKHHCQAARDTAQRCFDANKVLPRLINDAVVKSKGRLPATVLA